ncbi:diguanylate cyclase domain-containing protein [Falsibacillus pallidus]|uniref:PAS domain S-box-containing protein/diguanylate cyclase (GGDEF)-like protein n=1 Tax=Falsibacillus pallidus TaxID=493781 RepID=A0A370GEU7_9BACI|nr:diguanylate cyclase [Falsibacillus pallidus]RDI42325.1 PAS domain S-box-containing protein/diguanylate cyclase (GGDEF)-like protein [Falsibacillus pallidus]
MDKPRLPNFFTIKASAAQRKTAYGFGAFMLLLTLAALPFLSRQLIEVKPFLPSFIALVAFIDCVTGYLFYRQYRVSGSLPLLVLAGTFFYSGLITIPHILTFPHVFSETGLLGAGKQTAVWFWVSWHGGFPIGILFFLMALKYKNIAISVRNRKLTGFLTIAAVVSLVVVLTVLFTQFNDALPEIIHDNGYNSIITSGIGPVIWIMLLLAVIGLLKLGKMRTILDVWLTLAVFVFFIDVTVTLIAGSRYSLGWYFARINSFLSASVILSIFLYEMNRLYALLAEQQQRYQSLFMHNSDAVYSMNKERQLVSVNNACSELLGYTKQEYIHQNGGNFIAPEYKEASAYHFEQALTGKPQNYESVVLHKDGSRINVQITTIPIIIEGEVTGAFGILKDITLQKESEQKLNEANLVLKEMSLIDAMTGLANRRYLDQYLEEKWQECFKNEQPISFILLDLDNFKGFNDSYGHLEGDQCLMKVGRVLADAAEFHGLAARYGGEEMCIVLPERTIEFALLMAEEIRKEIEGLSIPHQYSSTGVVTASLGVSTIFPSKDTGSNEVIDHADQALYDAKRTGKNKVVSYAGVNS